MSLKSKVMLWFLPVIILPILINLAFSIQQLMAKEGLRIAHELNIEQDKTMRLFQQALSQTDSHLQIINSDIHIQRFVEAPPNSFLRNSFVAEIENLFNKYLTEFGSYQLMTVTGSQLEISPFKSNLTADLSEQTQAPEFVEIMTDEDLWHEYKANGRYQSFITLQNIENPLNEMLTIQLWQSIDFLKQHLNEQQLMEGAFSVLVDNQGEIIYNPKPSSLLVLDSAQWQALISKPVTVKVAIGESRLVNAKYQRLSENLGILYLWPDLKFINTLISEGWRSLVMGIVTLALLFLFFSLFMKKEIIGPISHLQYISDSFLEDAPKPSNLPLPNGEMGDLMSSFINMSDNLHKASKRLEHLAFFDELTGLTNRHMFLVNLEQQLINCETNEKYLGLLFIDLDGFKEVNDTLGHDAGDKLLKLVAMRLTESVLHFNSDKRNRQCKDYFIDVSRLGGDEFTVLISQIEDQNEIESMAKYLLQILSEPFVVGQHKFHIGASIGVTEYPVHGIEPIQLLKNADTAMYFAKAQGKNRYQFYEESLTAQTMRLYELRSALRGAIANNELSLKYQAQVNSNDLTVIGCEALLRWQHPTLGHVGPDEFIPVAEETGLILDIGQWVIEQSCICAKKWYQQYGIKVSVNVSAIQLRQSQLVSIVEENLSKHALDYQAIEIELTESTLMDKSSSGFEQLQKLQDLGVSIAMDDFGTGYSSLSQIQKLALNTIKIDKSFVSNLIEGEQAAAFIEAIIALAQKLNLQTTAEGVENQRELDFLKDAGVDFIQGYFISMPLTEVQFDEFMEKRA